MAFVGILRMARSSFGRDSENDSESCKLGQIHESGACWPRFYGIIASNQGDYDGPSTPSDDGQGYRMGTCEFPPIPMSIYRKSNGA